MTDKDFNPMTPHAGVLTFDMLRAEDATGTSGTGVVAMGVLFPDGTTVLQWQSHVRSTVVYHSMADALYIHGHGDKTGFRFHVCPERLYLSDGTYINVLKPIHLAATNDNKVDRRLCPCGDPEYDHTPQFHPKEKTR